jgi:hypothetical protein
MKEKKGREERETGREGRVGGECVSFKPSDNSDFHITGFRSNLSQILAILFNTQPASQPKKKEKTQVCPAHGSWFFLTLF